MTPNPWLTVVAAWLIPGAGHFLNGQTRKALVFGVVLTAMFLIGLACEGEFFAFDTSQPLVFLAAAAEWALGLPRAIAGLAGAGVGNVRAVSYEYGNTFLIVGGLLNALVVLDALDIARGIKRR